MWHVAKALQDCIERKQSNGFEERPLKIGYGTPNEDYPKLGITDFEIVVGKGVFKQMKVKQ